MDKPVTKRGVLSTTSSIYDPLGFASLFMLKAKAIFQELCRVKVDWDKELPVDVAAQWHRWLNDLPLLSALTIPRCLRPTSTSCLLTTQLHHFSDASELAYGAVSYIRIGDTCRLVMSKARLAPIKPVSMPRLELLAAVVATELDQHIKCHLAIPIERTFFWTDSTIVLQYINNKHCHFKTFVANRISKIHERSEPCQWKHIGPHLRNERTTEIWAYGRFYAKLGIYQYGRERWLRLNLTSGLSSCTQVFELA